MNDNHEQQETKKSPEPTETKKKAEPTATTTAEKPCAKSKFHFLTWHDGQRTCYCKTNKDRKHSTDLSAGTTASTNTNGGSHWNNAVPTLETRGETEFPYFSMIETDKSVRKGRSDRSIVIVPKAKEISVTSETPRVIIGNTPVYSGKYYQVREVK